MPQWDSIALFDKRNCFLGDIPEYFFTFDASEVEKPSPGLKHCRASYTSTVLKIETPCRQKNSEIFHPTVLILSHYNYLEKHNL